MRAGTAVSTIHNDNVPSNIIVCPWLMDAVVGFCEYIFCGHRHRVCLHTHTHTLAAEITINEMRNVHRIYNDHLHTNYSWFGVSSLIPLTETEGERERDRTKIVEEKESETERCLAQQRNYYYYKKLSPFHITCIHAFVHHAHYIYTKSR